MGGATRIGLGGDLDGPARVPDSGRIAVDTHADGLDRGAGIGTLIALDWGTTSRRAFLLGADGAVRDAVRDDRGVLALARDAYPDEIERLRQRFGPLPVLAAGMVGSTLGWRDAGYVDAPADLHALAAAAVTVGERVIIVPGVATRGIARVDVMRGEEVQALGAVAAGLVPADALVCQPGTHAKWITLEAGRVVGSATAITGELFSLLRGHGTLAGLLDGAVEFGPVFEQGLRRGCGAPDLTAAMFEARAAVLLGTLPVDHAAAFVSGVLIGADVGGRADLAGRRVHLVATRPLAALYAAALTFTGADPVLVDAERAFVAGIHSIGKLLP